MKLGKVPMLVLYHFGGAICAQKVRLALAEKGLDWESRDCSGPALRDPEYLKLNPGGVVPTLVHDGRALTESRIISEYINDAFEGPPLMPSDPRLRHEARLWSKQIDDSLHLNVFILTFAFMAREMFLSMPFEKRAIALPGAKDPVKRRISEELLESGPSSPWVGHAVKRLRGLVADMEVRLETSPYLAGPDYTLADADYTAYLERLIDLGLARSLSSTPHLHAWWERMKKRPSYGPAIIQWKTADEVARYQAARESFAEMLGSLPDVA